MYDGVLSFHWFCLMQRVQKGNGVKSDYCLYVKSDLKYKMLDQFY